jgi:hypothetical protein
MLQLLLFHIFARTISRRSRFTLCASSTWESSLQNQLLILLISSLRFIRDAFFAIVLWLVLYYFSVIHIRSYTAKHKANFSVFGFSSFTFTHSCTALKLSPGSSVYNKFIAKKMRSERETECYEGKEQVSIF